MDQTLFLFLLKEEYLENVEVDQVKQFATRFASFVEKTVPETYQRIFESQDIGKQDIQELKAIAGEFSMAYAKTS